MTDELEFPQEPDAPDEEADPGDMWVADMTLVMTVVSLVVLGGAQMPPGHAPQVMAALKRLADHAGIKIQMQRIMPATSIPGGLSLPDNGSVN